MKHEALWGCGKAARLVSKAQATRHCVHRGGWNYCSPACTPLPWTGYAWPRHAASVNPVERVDVLSLPKVAWAHSQGGHYQRPWRKLRVLSEQKVPAVWPVPANSGSGLCSRASHRSRTWHPWTPLGKNKWCSLLREKQTLTTKRLPEELFLAPSSERERVTWRKSCHLQEPQCPRFENESKNSLALYFTRLPKGSKREWGTFPGKGRIAKQLRRWESRLVSVTASPSGFSTSLFLLLHLHPCFKEFT